MIRQIKSSISRLKNFIFSSRRQKEEIAFFIQKFIQAEVYRRSLAEDGHEADEIEEQLLISEELISQRARIYMYETFTRELVFDMYDKQTRDNLFFSSVDYYRKNIKGFDFQTYIDKYFAVYGIAEKLPELILKASIKNDVELEVALKKHYHL